MDLRNLSNKTFEAIPPAGNNFSYWILNDSNYSFSDRFNLSIGSSLLSPENSIEVDDQTYKIEAVFYPIPIDDYSNHYSELHTTADLNSSIIKAKSEGETSVTSNPSAYNLITQSAYDEMMNELMSASGADTTPYSEGWLYLPNHGWLWTTRTTYPYFFDGTSKAWMYFQSGNDKPRFYHYGTKTWMTVE